MRRCARVCDNAVGEKSSDPATLTVLAENKPQSIALLLRRKAGSPRKNAGNTANKATKATFVQKNDLPVFSTKVPTGAFAPKGNTSIG